MLSPVKKATVRRVHPTCPTTPPSIRIAVISGAPGDQETAQGKLFVGSSGTLLDRMLEDVGIDRSQIYLGTVFRDRPLNDSIDEFFIKRAAWTKHKLSSLHPQNGGHGFVHPSVEQDVDRLLHELTELQPHVIIALGPTALWAITGETLIGKFRGTVMSTRIEGVKCIPTYHPTAIHKQWTFLPTAVMDFKKAVRESRYPEIRHEQRYIHIPTTLADLNDFARDHINGMSGHLSVDLETMWTVGHQITVCGMAPTKRDALVIPFWDYTKPQLRYWSAIEEPHVWRWIKDVMENPDIGKLFHNASYDVQVFKHFGIQVRGDIEDTMLIHHALQPELPKSLGYLASLYTNDPAWKESVNWSKTADKKDG